MSKLLFGAAYYPEDWDEDQIVWDAEKMKENGFNVARIGEFAWAKDEPKEGEFHFEWLHYVIDTLAKYGVKTIMCTPTATPPNWLYSKYPDMASLLSNGQRRSHGGRRHCCSKNPNYLRYSAIIVEKLAKEFADDENIIGWQIDNEIYPSDDACYCEHCLKGFHKHLEDKYGTVESINKAWNLNLFSQKYDRIDDIPFPINAWHNPHLKMEWKLFQAQEHIDFLNMQADILHKYVRVPVGTDTMPLMGFDYRKLEEKMDIVQFNHYQTRYTEYLPAFWFDYMRTVSKLPLINTETQPCWNGATAFGMKLPTENFIYFNSCLPIILGGEGNLYWLWRTHWAGHELMHGAVYDSCGRETFANCEIRKASSDMRRAEEFLTNTSVKSDILLTVTSLNSLIKTIQIVDTAYANEIMHKSLDDEPIRIYKMMSLSGMHPDASDIKEDISSYKLILSPLCYTLEEGNFEERITRWVENGGVWIVGPLSDIRTSIGTKYKTAPYGFLEKLTGAHLKYTLPDDDGALTVTNAKGKVVKCGKSYELFDDEIGKAILTVTDGHQSLKNLKCVAEYKVGKGYVIMLGTMPEDEALLSIIKYGAALAGASVFDTDDAFVISRRGEKHNGEIAASLEGNSCSYRFNGRKKDLITGEVYENIINLKPYQIAVLENDN